LVVSNLGLSSVLVGVGVVLLHDHLEF
jgi:hypothetical protein